MQKKQPKQAKRPTATDDGGKPYVIAIVAMGPTSNEYQAQVMNRASRFAVADATWTINAATACFEHDRAVIMDDLPYFAKEGRSYPHLAGYKDWLSKPNQAPIYTSRVYPEFPAAVEYPLEAVLNDLGFPYLNNTVAYAIALAIHEKPKEIQLYGCDFTHADGRADSEAGRACCEYWIAVAAQRGIKIRIADGSTLCDRSKGGVSLYGYARPPKITRDQDGAFKVALQ